MSDKRRKTPVDITEMSAEDLPQVLSIERKSFPSPWSAGMFAEALDFVHSRALVAKLWQGRKAEIAGYIMYVIVVGEAHLHNLAVRPDLRGRGIALKLMETMIEHSRAEGAVQATLEVRPSNRAAINLYEKLGFVVKGVRPLYYSDTGEDALIMWADLEDRGMGEND